MKRIGTLLFLLCGMFVSVQAQTAEEIVSNYLENIGGEEALRGITTMKMSAKVDAQGMVLPVTVITQKDGKSRTSFELQGNEIVQQAFDGETGWGINFMTQKAEPMETEDVENLKREMQDYPDPFIDYEKKGYSIELLGKETIEGVECFKLNLTKNPMLVNGEEVENVVTYYFDVDNFVPIVSEQIIMSGEMKGKISQTIYSDYQEVEGMYFPFYIENKVKGMDGGQPITFEKIELNLTFEDSIFMMPEETETKE
ncbi:MAG: outer membrane lipoprotein-sorting protein [Bacteroidota bacterium]